MKTVVITGSTRGIGYGLAEAFLDSGCQVVLNGRSSASVEQAIEQLAAQYDPACLHGFAADMAVLSQIEALWATAVAHFGQVDIWINNAGLSHDMLPMWELSPERVKTIVDTNILGVMNGSRVAIRGMLAKDRGSFLTWRGLDPTGKSEMG